GVVDLADDRCDLGYPERARKLVVEAAGDLDLEAPVTAIDDLESVPACRSGLVDLKLQIAQIREAAGLLDGLVGQVPLRDTAGEDRDPHDLEGLRPADSLLEVDIDPHRKRREIYELGRKARIDPPLEPTDSQATPKQKEPRKAHLTLQEMHQQRSRDLSH